VLSSDQKGVIAETAIIQAAVKLGIPVSRPVLPTRYDLIFDLGPQLVRVQCKWAVRRGDVVSVRCYSSRRSGTGFVRRSYSPDEIDALVAYCPDVDRCYFLSLERFHQQAIQLRLGPTRNNQRAGVHWAGEYEFGATLAQFGAVAQLGERCDGIAEARGSNPLGSTEVAGSSDFSLLVAPRRAPPAPGRGVPVLRSSPPA
jgi:PD-(D/E)XK endonuclease